MLLELQNLLEGTSCLINAANETPVTANHALCPVPRSQENYPVLSIVTHSIPSQGSRQSHMHNWEKKYL